MAARAGAYQGQEVVTMANDSVLRIILARAARSWRHQARSSGGIAMSGRRALLDCAGEIEEILNSGAGQAQQPPRVLEVTVYGLHRKMVEEALRRGREFFPGMEVTLAGLHVSETVSPGRLALAAAAGAPGLAGLATVRAVEREDALQPPAEGTCLQ
jgi:hypothetical protein